MDRVRAGLTGLGIVFLFTLAASAVLDPVPTVSASQKMSGEPLAQLGVAPGSESSRAEAMKADEIPVSGVHDEALAAFQTAPGRPVRI